MAPCLVVIDTNVLVSALLSKHEDASTVKVMEAFFSSQIIPLYNDEILDEYDTVLHREKFHFSEELVHSLMRSIRVNGISVDRVDTGEIFPDLNDLVFYEVCMAKQPEGSMLVTGNIKHFPPKPFIVTPNDLIEIINNK